MAIMSVKTKAPKRDVEQSTDVRPSYAARTILFNDDEHSFDDVASQLTRAIRCTYSKGLDIANVVHHLGSAVVYSGHLERCEAVAMVLGEIDLRVTVER